MSHRLARFSRDKDLPSCIWIKLLLMNYAYIFNEKRAQILQLFSSKPLMKNAGWSRPTEKDVYP